MSRPGWNGRTTHAALTLVLNRDGDACAICDHPGANSVDHEVPVVVAPELEWEPSNWRASHLKAAGQTQGCTHPQCTCPGNIARGAVNLTVVRAIVAAQNPKPSTREW